MFRSPHALPLLTLLSAFAIAIGAATFMSVGTAHAEIDGPCSATIAGVDVGSVDSGNRDDDIEVSQDQSVAVSGAAAAGFASHKIQLEFAGRRWTVSDEEDDGSASWSDTVNVDDYATYGVGLYKVIGVSTLTDGTTCTGAATVDVDGNPLTTVAGAAAAGVTAVGAIGALGSGVVAATGSPGPLSEFGPLGEMTGEAWQEQQRTRRRSQEMTTEEAAQTIDRALYNPFFGWFGCLCLAAIAVIMTPLMAMTGGGGGSGGAGNGGESEQTPTPSAGGETRLPRAPWLPRVTLVGLVGGFLAGAGSVVLMQQYSIEYPTLAVVLRNVIVMTLIGGVVLPTIGYTISWIRINARIRKLEQEVQ